MRKKIEPLYIQRLRKRVEKLRTYLVKEFPEEAHFNPYDNADFRQRVGFAAGFFIQEIDEFLNGWEDPDCEDAKRSRKKKK